MKSLSEYLLEQKKQGTYVGVRFTDDTKKAIKKYIEENEIPNSIDVEKLHTTLIFSRKHLPNFTPKGKLNPTIKGTYKHMSIWKTQNEKNALVMEYDSKDMKNRHEEIMDEHNATYDFDEYKPHLTLSYDVSDIDIKSYPEYDGPVEIDFEYTEPLDLDWSNQ